MEKNFGSSLISEVEESSSDSHQAMYTRCIVIGGLHSTMVSMV